MFLNTDSFIFFNICIKKNLSIDKNLLTSLNTSQKTLTTIPFPQILCINPSDTPESISLV